MLQSHLPSPAGRPESRAAIAHGFITWAAGTLIAAVVLGSAAASLLGVGADVAAAAGSTDAQPNVTTGVAATAAIYMSLSMVVGAFIDCISAALAGHQRDQHP